LLHASLGTEELIYLSIDEDPDVGYTGFDEFDEGWGSPISWRAWRNGHSTLS